MPSWVEIIVRTVVSIVSLLVLTRIIGKRQISQMTFFEYVAGITIGSLAGFISTDMEGNFLHGFTSMIIWALVPALLGYLSLKSKRIHDMVEGNATVLIKDGKIMEDNLKKERYSSEELLEQLRLKNARLIWRLSRLKQRTSKQNENTRRMQRHYNEFWTKLLHCYSNKPYNRIHSRIF